MATEHPQLDPDEDLYNFAEVDRATATPVAPHVEVAAPQPALPAVQIASVKPVVAHVHEVPATPAPAPVRAVAASRHPSATTLALLAAAIASNVLLVGVVWRSMSGMNHALERVGERAAPAVGERASEAAPDQLGWDGLKLAAPASSEGELALAAAAEDIRQGEYERARARLYSLLSVIDRFDAALRPNLAARAQVLAADAYREQADAVEREAAAPAEAGKFMDEPTEKHE